MRSVILAAKWECSHQVQLKVQAALCKTCFILFAVCQAYTSICQAYSDSDMDLMLSDGTLMIKSAFLYNDPKAITTHTFIHSWFSTFV